MRRGSRPRPPSSSKQLSTASSTSLARSTNRRHDQFDHRGHRRTGSLLPWKMLLSCTAFVGVARLYIVLHPDSWWQTHADEIYQSVEMAHINLYGYGFRPYEYAPVPGIDGEPDNSTLSRQIVNRELLQHGMFALRSHIVPAFYTVTLWIGHQLAPHLNHVVLAKVIHICITSWLPLAVYLFARQCLWTFLQPSIAKEEDRKSSSNKNSPEYEHEMRREFVDDIAGIALMLTTLSEPLLVLSTHTLVNSLLSPLAWLAMANLCFSLRPSTSDSTDDKGDTEDSQQLKCALLSGVSLGLLVYIRLDMLLFISLLFSCLHAPFVCLFKERLLPFLLAALSFTGGITLGGWVDQLTYGQWFVSPVQWFRFNIEKDYATAIFGEYPSWEYLQRIFVNDPVVAILTLITMFSWIHINSQKQPGACPPALSSLLKQTRQVVGRLFAALLMLFLIYSSKGHKELRFLHDWIVLLLVVNATGVYCLSLNVAKSKSSQRLVLCTVILIFSLSSCVRFPRSHNGSNHVWAWQRSRQAADVNRCLDWLSKQRGMWRPTGIFIDHNIYGVAGHSVLHQPGVDIISLLNSQFREWDRTARRHYKPALSFQNKGTFVNTFHDCSFMCTTEATTRLAKHLLLSPRYNYVVMPTERVFIETGYHEVKRFATMIILRRTTNKEENEELVALGKKASLGSSADILEREGEILVSAGKGQQAVEVLSAVLQLDRSRTKAEQLLQLAKKMTSQSMSVQ